MEQSLTAVIGSGQLCEEIAARRQAEAELRTFTDHAGDAIWISSYDGRYLYANPAACRLTGHTLEDLQTMSIPDLVPAEDRDRLPAHFQEQTPGYTQRSEWRLRRKDGSAVEVELTTQILPDNRRLGIGRDISQRKMAEAALRASQLRFFTAFHSSPED
jgi:PAS domain S-box-containing protein